MKKSMIISTIAMIVVVVVALSTATYAWFSSSNYATASIEMSTTSSADWTLYKGTTSTASGEREYTFTGGAQSSIELSPAMKAGLYSPTDVINVNLKRVNATAKATNAKFYSAKTNGKTITIDTAEKEMAVDVFRVVNSKTLGGNNTGANDKRTLLLTVVVNAGSSDDSTGTRYAAAALSYNIQYITDVQNATAVTVTNGYGKGSVSGTGSGAEAIEGSGQPNSGSSGRPTYSSAGTSSVFTKNDAGDEALGINKGDYVLTYVIEIGEVQFEQGVTFAIYTWIDGWTADASAAGADFSVTYAFTTKPQQA